MADNKPGYSLVAGDGGRASGLIRRKIAEEGGSGSGFLDLSLGSIYNSPSSVAEAGYFSPDAAEAGYFSPDASAVPFVAAATAATAAYASPAPASRASTMFALGFAAASAVPGDDGNGGHGGHVLVRASNAALPVANPVSVLPPLLFTSDGSAGAVTVPVPVPVHGNATAAPPPPPPNKKSPRGQQRGNATGRRRRRRDDGAAGDNADADATNDNVENAPPPFPWATKTAGTHPTLAELIERGIDSVEGEVRCKRCDAGKTISYEIRARFEELSGFILRNVEAMHDRAPPEWMHPVLPDCDKCGQKNSLRPVIAAEKWRINWMFLLLGQTLGLCTLEQLKHFCARTRQHRTGAKDRVLYSTYMELCNQLCPGGPFDMASERKNRIRPFA